MDGGPGGWAGWMGRCVGDGGNDSGGSNDKTRPPTLLGMSDNGYRAAHQLMFRPSQSSDALFLFWMVAKVSVRVLGWVWLFG